MSSSKEIVLSNNSREELSEKDILFKTIIGPRIEERFKSHPDMERKLINYIGAYRDKNIDILSSSMINKNMFFTSKDREALFKATGFTIEEIDELISMAKPPDGSKKGMPDNITPFNVLIVMLIRYYIMNKKPKEMEIMGAYHAYSTYFSLYTKYFGVPINEDIMRATVNKLSYKFDLKALGTVDKMLRQTNSVAIDGYKERMIRGNDSDIIYVILQLKQRLNGKINKIKNEYEITKANGEVLFKEKGFTDEGEVLDNGGVLSDIQNSASYAVTKFYSMPDVDMKTIEFCSKAYEVSKKDLRSTIHELTDKKYMNEIMTFYESLFYLYYDNGGKPNNIKSRNFYVICSEVYKKGNSNDKNIKRIKELLHKWLSNGSNMYRTTERFATINQFRKATYFYFVIILMK